MKISKKARLQEITTTEDEIAKARDTAIAISQDATPNIKKLLYSEKLDDVEIGIKQLNEFSDKCWLLSALSLYTLIYNKNMYTQSGLTWTEYLAESKKRLGLDKREVSSQLSSARFFIKHYDLLIKEGWNPIGSARKLEKAELALELSGDVKATVKHIAKDTWAEFKDWYTSFRPQEEAPALPHAKIKYVSNSVYVDDIEAVTVSPELDNNTRARYLNYIRQVFDILKTGKEPVISDK